MFVRKSKYDALLARYRVEVNKHYEDLKAYNQLLDKWNTLAKSINRKGGEAFLNSTPQISKEDIQRLIVLCHPDKHEGKKIACDMTARLLGLKKQFD